MVVCEAGAADCLYRSGRNRLESWLMLQEISFRISMAGLACGEGNTIGWEF